MKMKKSTTFISVLIVALGLYACSSQENNEKENFAPKFKLLPADKIKFNSFVDCNMAEAWIGDTFRIFPGKYGEDPLWEMPKI